MNTRSIAAIVVAAGVVALIVAKETRGPDPSPAAPDARAARSPQVVLVADPREAGSSCGCGQIIRMVRAARAQGVDVVEVAPGSSESRRYRATVNPTVVFLDGAGAAAVRYEGEAADTIAGIRRHLEDARRR